MIRVAVPSISFCQTEVLCKELLAKYPNTRFNENNTRMSRDELIHFLSERDAAIMGLEALDAEMLDQLPDLKIISRMGVGLDNIDPAMLRERGIRIGWVGGTNSKSVAELTIAFMVCAVRHVAALYEAMRSGKRPRQRMGRLLSGRTIGLHGCGNVGKEIVRLLQPWDCTILVHDIINYSEFYETYKIKPVSFEELVRNSEILSLHIPLNDSTRNLYTAEVLELMKNDAVLINTCRGGIVDEKALKIRLLNGKLMAACMDTFAVEPPVDDELLAAENFLCTPHIGGSAEEARLAMGRAAIEGIEKSFVPIPGVFPFN
tara:strand:+ start:1625 stop:2575 length:951 start_codon:yes stop_codon:yes gene_type:complete